MWEKSVGPLLSGLVAGQSLQKEFRVLVWSRSARDLQSLSRVAFHKADLLPTNVDLELEAI